MPISALIPNPVYDQTENQIETLNNNQVQMVGTTVISGNIPRTVLGWWRTTQKDSYNIYECGRGKSGQSFSLGRWFGEHGTSVKGLTCHTWSGCYNNDVSKSGSDIGPSDNTWNHFAHVWDGSTHYIYFNGELYSKGSDAGNRILNTYGDGCVFGSKDARFNFKGDVKGLKIYSAALTSEQIKYLKGFISRVKLLSIPILFCFLIHTIESNFVQ